MRRLVLFFALALQGLVMPSLARAQALEILQVEGEARLQDQPVSAGAVLPDGAELRTGPEGFLGIRLSDAVLLALLPGSQARMVSLRPGGITIALQQGRLESLPADPATAGPAPLAPLPVEVQTPVATITGRAGTFRVALGSNQSASIEATGGPVDVRPASGAPLQLPAGTGVMLQSGRALAPRPLLAAPKLWGGLRLVAQLPFDLDFSPMGGVRGYRVAVHSMRERRGLVFETLAYGSVARLSAVANGDYLVRVRAVDGEGLHGQETAGFLRVSVRGGPPRLSSPLAGTRIFGDRVDFFWRPKEDAEGYILEIARDPAFRAIVTRTPQLPDPRYVAEGLPPGDYFWRVAARQPDGQLGLFSEGRSFAVRAGAPVLAAPKVDAEALRFQWPAAPNQRFELQVSADREFRLIVSEHAVDKLPVAIPRPPQGSYFARIRRLDAEGPGPYAAPVAFTIAPPPPKPACLVEGPKGVCAVFAPGKP